MAYEYVNIKTDTINNVKVPTKETLDARIPHKISELTNDSFVSYVEQTLTENQQNQAKMNLGIDVLTGDTITVTPTQVKEAILAGRPVAITYVDYTYGILIFTNFGYSHENNVIVANLIIYYNSQYIFAELVGLMSNDGEFWSLQTTELGTSTDIANNYVKYSESQTLTNEQKAQARTNIGAISEADLVQPDWNQNDETAPDYVKNRPFYTGDPVETVLVEESTTTFVESNGFYVARFQSTFEATVGETYTVSWDGTTYECACIDFNGNTVIGNLSIAGAGSDTGEPFVMIVQNRVGIEIATKDTSASHTFSISGFVPEVVKIDEKYLPDNLATKSEVEAAKTTAETAQSTANTAKTIANNAQSIASNAQSKANTALNTANTAKSTADTSIEKLNTSRLVLENTSCIYSYNNSSFYYSGIISGGNNINILANKGYNIIGIKRITGQYYLNNKSVTIRESGDFVYAGNTSYLNDLVTIEEFNEYFPIESYNDSDTNGDVLYIKNLKTRECAFFSKESLSICSLETIWYPNLDGLINMLSQVFATRKENQYSLSLNSTTKLSTKYYMIEANDNNVMITDTSNNTSKNLATEDYVTAQLKSLPVDNTTIKLNDQGQLTLALSNANEVSF